MKILHTADWHIGKILHKHALSDELHLFFNWLIELITAERINVLLVAGDIFDLANPSALDRKLYYQFLKRLIDVDIKIIITGGNHDSPGFLNAPKDLFEVLNISIIGGMPEDIKDEIILVKNKREKIELVVAAVPFLRDRDVRNAETDSLYKNRTEAIREGIKKHYSILADICNDQYKGIPTIAMGHLYAVGSESSDSERDIHVGNAAAIPSDAFSDSYDYIALGHIHKPQRINKNNFIRYSGSPIALSFSEKKDAKQVLIIELIENKIQEPEIVQVPKFRELKKFSGTLSSIKEKLYKYDPEYPLISFVEIEVVEDVFSSEKLAEAEELKSNYLENKNFKILKARTEFKTGTTDTSHLFEKGEKIENLTPKEVFRKKLESENYDLSKQNELIETFQELLEMVEQGGEV